MPIWMLALAIGTLAVTPRLRPELYVLGAASIAAMIGALMLIDVGEVFGSAVATVTAAGTVAVGLARHHVPILVIGVLAFLQSLQGPSPDHPERSGRCHGRRDRRLAVVIVVVVRSTRGPKHIGGQNGASL